ncbi:hypothetical protein SAMN05661010_01347 [Modicisalibacter muralis]|uniref:Uncharacterized protein n=1 Tax=Modicisalibacter muralis TaxID=119000 RepID=A0A1G9IV97_9GAMM|nr:hypothetical protein SAMN05661010_01347 [Halomonas muralis]
MCHHYDHAGQGEFATLEGLLFQESLNKLTNEMKRKEPGAQEKRHNMQLGCSSSTA